MLRCVSLKLSQDRRALRVGRVWASRKKLLEQAALGMLTHGQA